jgi:predicted ArsR family transcriptional regulator
MTLAALAAESGLHVNTVREHLAALEQRGLVQRGSATPRGRGRPASLYRAVEPDDRSEYAGLATALAAMIHRTSDHPRDDAIKAGEGWGRELARAKAGPQPSAQDARGQVVALLGDLGFAPDADERDAVVRLTRCPLLDVAHRYPDVVCGVHLGIVQAALDEFGGEPSGADLVPFSEPGACRLQLTPRRGRRGRSFVGQDAATTRASRRRSARRAPTSPPG